MKNKTIAIFDFDGTITNKNSFIHFVEFLFNKRDTYIGLFFLSPIFLLFKLKILNNKTAMNNVIKFYINGMSKEKLEEQAKIFNSSGYLNRIVKKSALDKIKYHQNLNHKVIIVSASSETWIKDWCDGRNIELLSNKLKFNKNNIYKGGFLTLYCWGDEKVRRIRELFDMKKYKEVYVYGDTNGDKSMLKLATKNKSFYKFFN